MDRNGSVRGSRRTFTSNSQSQFTIDQPTEIAALLQAAANNEISRIFFQRDPDSWAALTKIFRQFDRLKLTIDIADAHRVGLKCHRDLLCRRAAIVRKNVWSAAC